MTTVEEHPTELLRIDTMLSVMGWVRKVPSTTSHSALAVLIVPMITHWPHALLTTSPLNALTIHLALYFHTYKLVLVPLKLPSVVGWLGTQGLSITVSAIGPAMAIAFMLQCPVVVAASTVHVGSK
jgi:hypothetical protein